jgi:cystathionine beta-lyase/cystathionine gamma-synthase
MKTLGVRVARQNATAMRVADWLEHRKGIARVYYPGLESHPDHAVAKCQMKGYGGVVTFDVQGGYAAACRVFDHLTIVQRAASLGGVESMCSLPVLTSQYGFNDDQLAAAGVTRGMIRTSIGLEDADDLIADLDQAIGN